MPLQRDVIGSRTFVPRPAEALLPRLAQPLLCTALLSLAGCDEEAVFTKLFTSDHFDYYVEEGRTPPCDATAQLLERYYSANAKFLGATLPDGEKIQYYLARTKEGLSKCGAKSARAASGKSMPLFTRLVRHFASSQSKKLVSIFSPMKPGTVTSRLQSCDA